MKTSTNEVDILEMAILDLHKCKAIFKENADVREKRSDEDWERKVHTFTLINHPSSKIAYAWLSPVEGKCKRSFYAVLHQGSVNSPATAVQSALFMEYQSGVREALAHYALTKKLIEVEREYSDFAFGVELPKDGVPRLTLDQFLDRMRAMEKEIKELKEKLKLA